MNLLIVSGNLGKDCVVNYTADNKPVGKFSMAVTSGWSDNKKTTWITCKLFGERAEKLAPYLTKGSKPTVSGEFCNEEWTTQDGEKRTTATLYVDKVSLGAKHGKPEPKPQDNQSDDVFDDDIPF